MPRMSTDEHGRRTARQSVRMRVLLRAEGAQVEAYTGVVSPTGALILSPRDWPLGTILQIQNAKNNLSSPCKVVWRGGEESPGLHKLGVEFPEVQQDFWGEDYQPASSQGA
jgi:hypothetical protein